MSWVRRIDWIDRGRQSLRVRSGVSRENWGRNVVTFLDEICHEDCHPERGHSSSCSRWDGNGFQHWGNYVTVDGIEFFLDGVTDGHNCPPNVPQYEWMRDLLEAYTGTPVLYSKENRRWVRGKLRNTSALHRLWVTRRTRPQSSWENQSGRLYTLLGIRKARLSPVLRCVCCGSIGLDPKLDWRCGNDAPLCWDCYYNVETIKRMVERSERTRASAWARGIILGLKNLDRRILNTYVVAFEEIASGK